MEIQFCTIHSLWTYRLSWLQSMHKHFFKPCAWQLPFQEEEDTSLLQSTVVEETRNPFWCLGGSQIQMNENVDLHFSRTDKGCMFFSLLWCREQAIVSYLKNKPDFWRRLTIYWFMKHAKIPSVIQDLGNLPSNIFSRFKKITWETDKAFL